MNVILALLAIGLLILIHEFGHLLAARAAGVPVARFVAGVGPTIARFRRGSTEYPIGLLPLGGGKNLLCLLEKASPRAERLHVPLSLGGWALVPGLFPSVTVLDVARLGAAA